MKLSQRLLMGVLALVLGLAGVQAADQKLTAPPESLGGLRPGVTIDQLNTRFGKPDVTAAGGLLQLYGGAKESNLFGWFMVKNPDYTVPDLAVETAENSKTVDLVMVIGYDGIKTERGVTCFQSEDDVIKAYGKPEFAFAVPMRGYVLRELYYPSLGISFDLAPTGPGPDRSVVAIYVTYPEYLTRAIGLRREYITSGVGKDITYAYDGGRES